MRADLKSGFLKTGLLFLVILLCSTTRGDCAPDCKKQVPVKRDSKNEGAKPGLLGKIANSVSSEHNTNFLGAKHSLKILPLAYLDLRTGVNLGFWAQLKGRSRNPFLYRLTLQILASHKNSHKHKLEFEYPAIGSSKLGFVVNAEWERDLEARYFGLSNESVNDDNLTNSSSPEFIDDDFYLYNLKRPRFTVYLTYTFLPKIKFWAGYGYEHVDPQLKRTAATSFLANDKPFGHRGGTGHHLIFRLTWDTRSDTLFPANGFITELSYEPNFASVKEDDRVALGTTQSRRVDFQRYTFSNANFFPLRCDRLILANRLAFEVVNGNVPYYALGDLPDLQNTRVVGGSTSLRGFQSRRFQDKVKVITLTELRFKATHVSILGQELDLIFVSFFDTGRVWSRLSDLSLTGFHRTFGGGVWVKWSENLIARLDIGISREQVIPYFRFSTAF